MKGEYCGKMTERLMQKSAGHRIGLSNGKEIKNVEKKHKTKTMLMAKRAGP